jgi:transcriptional regulator with GAF, ATPase, and Fis domain
MEKLDALVSDVAEVDMPVLIKGESGTGKELVAKAIHYNSSRADRAFIPFNCGAIPETLVESELFGHEKGAFKGGENARQGLLEIAHGGTVFLDEVAEMPLRLQPKLFQFLQTGEFQRLGGVKNLKSDVRIISATNKDLEEEVKKGKFRDAVAPLFSDLYERVANGSAFKE